MKKIKNIFIEGPINPAFVAESITKHTVKTNIGGHSIFLGQIREDVMDDKKVQSIEFTTYQEMALEKAHEIHEEIITKYGLTCAHIYHSLGNIKVGEIINPNTNFIVLKEKFDLIYLKSEKNCEAKIEGYVNSFTETKVLFSKLIDQKREINQNVFSISETNFNIDDLYNLAFESGKMSRFNLDKKFGRTKFEELYVKWVDNSINKVFADDVFVYQENNKTLGFITYKIDEDFSTIGLNLS